MDKKMFESGFGFVCLFFFTFKKVKPQFYFYRRDDEEREID